MKLEAKKRLESVILVERIFENKPEKETTQAFPDRAAVLTRAGRGTGGLSLAAAPAL